MRLLFIGLMLLPSLAFAQEDYTLLGAGIWSRPKFDGSRERVVEPIPVLRYYGERWFARTTQGILEGGQRWNLRPDLEVGAQVAYESGPRDGSPDASVGVQIEGDHKIGPVPLNGLVRLRQHLNTERGLEVDARATIGVYEGHGVQAGLFAQGTWASERHFESYYGVHESGLLFTSIGALASYDLTQRWLLVGSAERRRLSDEAARSPIVEKPSGTYASIGVGYRF